MKGIFAYYTGTFTAESGNVSKVKNMPSNMSMLGIEKLSDAVERVRKDNGFVGTIKFEVDGRQATTIER